MIKHIRNFNTTEDIPQNQRIGKFTSKQLEIVEQYKWDFKIRKFQMCIYIQTLIYINIWFLTVSLNSNIYTILPHRIYIC